MQTIISVQARQLPCCNTIFGLLVVVIFSLIYTQARAHLTSPPSRVVGYVSAIERDVQFYRSGLRYKHGCACVRVCTGVGEVGLWFQFVFTSVIKGDCVMGPLSLRERSTYMIIGYYRGLGRHLSTHTNTFLVVAKATLTSRWFTSHSLAREQPDVPDVYTNKYAQKNKTKQ